MFVALSILSVLTSFSNDPAPSLRLTPELNYRSLTYAKPSEPSWPVAISPRGQRWQPMSRDELKREFRKRFPGTIGTSSSDSGWRLIDVSYTRTDGWEDGRNGFEVYKEGDKPTRITIRF